MQKMLESYSRVHNTIYWDKVTPFIQHLSSQPLKIIDIGCGPGLLLRDLDNRFELKKLYALDLSEVMLEKCQETLEKPLGEGRAELILQHMQDEPDLPNDLDIVFSSRVLRSFDNLWEVLMSIKNALKPNGLLVLADWTQRSLEEYHAHFTGDGEDMSYILGRHQNFAKYSLDDWEFLLKKAGFFIEDSYYLDEFTHGLVARKS